MTIIRQVWPEQDATLHLRIPAFMKEWLITMADRTADRSMSDFVRDGIRLMMMEHGCDLWDDKGANVVIFKEKENNEQSPD